MGWREIKIFFFFFSPIQVIPKNTYHITCLGDILCRHSNQLVATINTTHFFFFLFYSKTIFISFSYFKIYVEDGRETNKWTKKKLYCEKEWEKKKIKSVMKSKDID